MGNQKDWKFDWWVERTLYIMETTVFFFFWIIHFKNALFISMRYFYFQTRSKLLVQEKKRYWIYLNETNILEYRNINYLLLKLFITG